LPGVLCTYELNISRYGMDIVVCEERKRAEWRFEN